MSAGRESTRRGAIRPPLVVDEVYDRLVELIVDRHIAADARLDRPGSPDIE